MTITEADWADLEADHHSHGLVTRRLFPQSPHDIFLAVRQPTGRRMMTLHMPADAVDETVRRYGALPRTRGMTLTFAAAEPGRRDLQIILEADDRRDVFNPLITDVAGGIQATDGPAEALAAAIDRFEHWRQLLQSITDSGLGPEARRGLYGELVVLRDRLLAATAPDNALRAWTGPTGTSQDFQLPTSAIEVKTGTGRQPQTIMIANERQLDTAGVNHLLLAHLSVDERRGGSGESLNAVVDTVRAAAATPSARAVLDDRLPRAGYLHEHRPLYDEPRYTVRGIRFWRVTGDFPRIVEADLRTGVGDCRYRISTTGLDRYVVDVEEVDHILKGET